MYSISDDCVKKSLRCSTSNYQIVFSVGALHGGEGEPFEQFTFVGDKGNLHT